MSEDTGTLAGDPTGPPSKAGLTEDERVGHYITMWKQSVEVQQHFNDIEWRIRGLALTVATFALGAAGLAVKDRTEVGQVSLGAVIVFVGLILWYAFYFVDRAWYHPLLKAAVVSGTRLENEIKKSLPEAGMTQAITEGSPYKPSRLVQILSRTSGDMRSDDKLVWFYTVGAAALVLVTIGLQAAAFATDPKGPGPQVVIEHGYHGKQGTGAGPSWFGPTPPRQPVP